MVVPFQTRQAGMSDSQWNELLPVLFAEYPLEIDAIRNINPYSVFVGRADLDGDGGTEVFLTLGLSVLCGSAGCETLVLDYVDGAWTIIESMMARIAIGGGPQVYLREAGADGWRSYYTADVPAIRLRGGRGALDASGGDVQVVFRKASDVIPQAEWVQINRALSESYLRISPDLILDADAVGVALFDLDHDGVAELIVSARVAKKCSSGMCMVVVLGRENDLWRPIGEAGQIYAYIDREGWPRVFVSTAIIDKFRVYYSTPPEG